jgi:high-affinity Fe2+/Pb2+ permease
MLNKRERQVMDIVYRLCGEEGSCLCAPWDILRQTSGEKWDEKKVEKILCDLQSDGYIGVIRSDRKGEPMYVLTLRVNGLSYRRENLQIKRGIFLKAALCVLGAIASFFIGLLLKSIFS